MNDNLARVCRTFNDEVMNKVADLIDGTTPSSSFSDDEIAEMFGTIMSYESKMRSRVRSGLMLHNINSDNSFNDIVNKYKQEVFSEIEQKRTEASMYGNNQDINMANMMEALSSVENIMLNNSIEVAQNYISTNGGNVELAKQSYINDAKNYVLNSSEYRGDGSLSDKHGESLMFKIGNGFYSFFKDLAGNIKATVGVLSDINIDNIASTAEAVTNFISRGISLGVSKLSDGIEGFASNLYNYKANSEYNIRAISIPLFESIIDASSNTNNPVWNRFVNILVNKERLGVGKSSFSIPLAIGNYKYRLIFTYDSMSFDVLMQIYASVPEDSNIINSDALTEKYLVDSFNILLNSVDPSKVYHTDAVISGLSDDVIRASESVEYYSSILRQYNQLDQGILFDSLSSITGFDVDNYEIIEGAKAFNLGVLFTDLLIIDPLFSGVSDLFGGVADVTDGISDFSTDRIVDLLSGIDTSIKVIGNGIDIGGRLNTYFKTLYDPSPLVRVIITLLFTTDGLCDFNSDSSTIINIDRKTFTLRARTPYENLEQLGVLVSKISVLTAGAFIGMKSPALLKRAGSKIWDKHIANKNRNKIIDGVVDALSDNLDLDLPSGSNTFAESYRVVSSKKKIHKL